MMDLSMSLLSKWQDATEIQVKVIHQNSAFMMVNKANLLHYQLKLRSLEHALLCMRGMFVTVDCTIDLATHFRLAKLRGIHSVIITSCSAEENTINKDLDQHHILYRITKTTGIRVKEVLSKDAHDALSKTHKSQKNAIAGLDAEKKKVTKLLLDRNQKPTAVLIKGPAGCGKSSLIHQIAIDCNAALLTVYSGELITADMEGNETHLTALFNKAERLSREIPCILLIDNLEALHSRREKHSTVMVVAALVGHLKRISSFDTNCGLLVILITNQPSLLDSSLNKHDIIAKEISISVPTERQRCQILKLCLKDMPLANDVDIDKLSTMMSGCLGCDIQMMCLHGMRKRIFETAASQIDCEIRMADFEEAARLCKPSLLRGEESFVDVNPVDWSEIGGLDDVKLQIQQAVEWPLKYAEAFQALGLPLTKGLLLTGPPGCGKTTLARAAATACHVTFLSLSCAQIYSRYVGDSEKQISETFSKARALAPSILFLDEIDAIVGRRSDSGSSVSERILSTLLNEMDGIGVRVNDSKGHNIYEEPELEGQEHKHLTLSAREIIEEERDRHVLVIGATNRPDMIDPALMRPGRIDRVIHVPSPDLKGREQAFRVHCKKMPLADDVDLNCLAKCTEGYSGADIMGICTEAGVKALTESSVHVTKQHFTAVLQEYFHGLDITQ